MRANVLDRARVRGVAAWLTTPLLPDDYLSLINPVWSARELRGRVDKVISATEDAATLVIKPGWGWSGEYKAGQYVGIGVDVNGRFDWRSYSLSSPPIRSKGHITITVKAMPEGFLSEHLVRGLKPGTIVRLAQPQGDFVLPEPPPARVLFLVAGSGITPVMAILRTLDRRGMMPDVALIHSSPTESTMIFRDELRRLATAAESFRLCERYTNAQGRLRLAELAESAPTGAAPDLGLWA